MEAAAKRFLSHGYFLVRKFLELGSPASPASPASLGSINLFAAAGVSVPALLLPVIALAAPRTFGELANLLVLILNNATVVLIVLGVVVYFFGISINILKFSEEGGERLRQYFFWGIIVLFVMVSIWGILRLLQNTLFGSNPYSSGGSVTPVQQEPFLPPQFIE